MRFNYNTHLRTNDLHKYLHLFDLFSIVILILSNVQYEFNYLLKIRMFTTLGLIILCVTTCLLPYFYLSSYINFLFAFDNIGLYIYLKKFVNIFI